MSEEQRNDIEKDNENVNEEEEMLKDIEQQRIMNLYLMQIHNLKKIHRILKVCHHTTKPLSMLTI